MSTISIHRRASAYYPVLVVAAVLGGGVAMSGLADQGAATDPAKTATPIKHVVVVIGENRSFDHVYATYVPQGGQAVLNLLSEGIVQADGSPGPNFAAARQFTTSAHKHYFIGVARARKDAVQHAPAADLRRRAERTKRDVAAVPQQFSAPAGGDRTILGAGRSPAAHDRSNGRCRDERGSRYPDHELRRIAQWSIPVDRSKASLRFLHWRHGASVLSDVAAIGLPHPERHRRQSDRMSQRSLSLCRDHLCRATGGRRRRDLNGILQYANRRCPAAQKASPTSTRSAITITNRRKVAPQFSTFFSVPATISSGATAMAIATVPPASQIANPNPKPGTNNQYRLDGRYSNCSDLAAPGVLAILRYLNSLPYETMANCARRALLHAKQYQSGFPAEWPAGCYRHREWHIDPAEQCSDDRRRP